MQIDQEDNGYSYDEYISNVATSFIGISLISSPSIDSNPDLEVDISTVKSNLM